MAVQTRRGAYENFDPDKLLAGEWATVLSGDPNASDGRAAYLCFDPGEVKRMATFEDMVENIDAVTGDIVEELTTEVNAATSAANTATQNANTAAQNANSKASAANTAATNAQNIADELEQKLENGDFAATVSAGTVTTGAAGTSASVTNSGTQNNAVFDFTIPQGVQGVPGTAATITVGTVTTGEPDTNASVTNVGTENAAVLNFVIPRGDPGSVENISQQPITFSESQEKSPLESGDTLGTLFGKTQKYQSENDDIIYEIGGRNLILDSENIEFIAYGGSSVTKESNVTVTEWETTEAKRVYGTKGSTNLALLMSQGRTYGAKNQEFVGSIYIKNSGKSNINVGRMNSYSTVVAAGESQRISFDFKPNSEDVIMQIQINVPDGDGSFDITYWRPKWEIGSTPTRWTPAPEDIENEIDGKLSSTGNGSSLTVNFTEASSVANITSGSTLAVLFGQILKNQNDFLDADTIQAAENAGILSGGG